MKIEARFGRSYPWEGDLTWDEEVIPISIVRYPDIGAPNLTR